LSFVYRIPDEQALTKYEWRQIVSIEKLLAGYGGPLVLDIDSLALYAGTVYGIASSNSAVQSANCARSRPFGGRSEA